MYRYIALKSIEKSEKVVHFISLFGLDPSPCSLFSHLFYHIDYKLFLKKEDFFLTNVSHEDVNGFLNASDIGILLRENDTLNKVASPGKLGEYLSSGLNILTTKHIGLYSKVMMNDKVGIIVDDIFDDKEILDKVQSFLPYKTKKEQSKWASDNFSVQAYKEIYINSLKNI